MKKEELLKVLIKELMGLQSLHREYEDNDVHYVIDSKNDGNRLVITIEYEEADNLKEEFEEWVNTLNDDLFIEAYEELSDMYEDDGNSVEEIYNSDDYEIVINDFKDCVKRVLQAQLEEIEDLNF